MALSERENLIILQLEQSLRADGRAGTRRRIVLTVATALAALVAVGLIAIAALAPASGWTLVAAGVAGVLIGGLLFSYRVPAQATAIRAYERLRHVRRPFRRRR